jgi:DNA-binding transcriptional regulator YdaS (Cro superfamily)
MEETGIDKAVQLAGSQRRLAKLLRITQQAVQQWVETGYVPQGRVDDVLDAVDPGCEHVRPRDLMDPMVVEMVDRAFGEEDEAN